MRIVKRAFGILAGGAVLFAAAAPQAAGAQMFMNPPEFKAGPIDGSDPLVGLPIAGATPAEYRAHLIWNLRSGLNVAALQCQFSPYLRTVDNYNGVLAHHSKELAEAYSDLMGYFKRVHGAKEGQKKFDDYSTSTYNGFSTLQAQLGFCNTAADIGKEALTKPKGQLFTTAQSRMRELRNSLVPAYDQIAGYNPYAIRLPAVPPLDDECYNKRGEMKDRCASVYAASR